MLSLPRWALATRNDFAWFLRASFSVGWRGDVSHTTVLPLPVPYPGVFSGGGPRLSRRRLKRMAQRRFVHLIAMTINHLYLDRLPTLEEIGRPPNEVQRDCIARLYRYVAVCGSRPGMFPIPPGRSGSELIASLARLEAFVDSNPEFQNHYGDPAKRTFPTKSFNAEAYEEYPQLKPYKNLDADRLKLSGTGSWPLDEYLEGPLWMAYVEPAFLLHNIPTPSLPGPDLRMEDKEQYWRLAERWSELGLLRLYEGPSVDGRFVRIFNAFKSRDCDRQIGDRRHMNNKERHMGGPSSKLPNGQLLTNIIVAPGHGLRGSITDRRDFYHQCRVSEERGRSQLTPFSFDVEDFAGMGALIDFEKAFAERERNKGRDEEGDRLGMAKKEKREFPQRLFPSFAALYQGDHLGVEFALGGHEALLRSEDLLQSSHRLQGHSVLPRSPVWEALVIDDFFVISQQRTDQPKSESMAYRLLHQARDAYLKHRLPGSPEKDVEAEELFKAAGAEVDSTWEARKGNLILVSCPLAKKVGLAVLSLRVAALPSISSHLAARLSGSWVSALLFRRCISSVVRQMFGLSSEENLAKLGAVMRLPRGVALELTQLSILIPLMATDVSSPVSSRVFATDASMEKGAIVESWIPKAVSECLWRGGDKKGSNMLLDNPFRALRRHIGEDLDEEKYLFDEEDYESFVKAQSKNIEKERPFFFDFVELCGGVGSVSKAMANRGYVVAPVLDLSASKQYNLGSLRMLEWLFFMLDEGRFRSLMCEPPCTSFSPAAHPAVRSYRNPKEFNRRLRKTLLGNLLAFRNLLVMDRARRRRRPALLEQPRLSKMAWLSAWRFLLQKGLKEAVVAACMFGSPHRKEFRMLLCELDPEMVEMRCCGGHHHIRIEGRYTKASAIYPEKMADHLALAFSKALSSAAMLEADMLPYEGKESIVVNDILSTARWTTTRSWRWKKKHHINVLETGSVVSLMKQLIYEEPDTRHNALVDSQVAKGAVAKGRSSARSLQGGLRKMTALQLAGGLNPAMNFAPTRLNPADAPTRDKEGEEPSPHSLLSYLDEDEIAGCHFVGLPRFAANWMRLVLLISYVECSEGLAVGSRCGLSLAFQATSYPQLLPNAGLSWLPLFMMLWIFSCLVCWIFTSSSWTFSVSSLCSKRIHSVKTFRPLGLQTWLVWLCLVLVLGCGPCVVSAMPMVPRTAVEVERAAQRSRIDLAADRVLRQQTRDNRATLLQNFASWVWTEKQISWSEVINRKPLDPEEISGLLVDYGRELHFSGRSYNVFAETINAVVMARPLLKRQVVEAWNLAYAWLVDEPYEHHPAMPIGILTAMITLALSWGWAVEAAILAMTWAGVLRIGEVIQAVRGDLVLPTDSIGGVDYILLKIHLPKTRGRSAKHQSARIDPKDLVALISAVFKRYPDSQRLWEFSPATLRRRFNSLQTAIGLPTQRSKGVRPFDLGSLRPGGATWILNRTESLEVVRRRGRWQSHRTMEIYLQEVIVATCEMKLPENVRVRVQNLNAIYAEVLSKAVDYLTHCIPTSAWFLLFQHHQSPGKGG